MILSVDDGCASDVRVAQLASRYGIEAIFYWPVEWHSLAYDKGYQPLSFIDARGIAEDFEIGAHTITHRHLTDLSPGEALQEMEESKWMLGNLFQKKITKFCPPRGYTNDNLTEMALRIFRSQRLTRGEGLVHIHPNSGANNNMPWREYLELEMKKTDKIELWGHSHEWDRYDMWNEIEEYLRENAS